MNYDIFVTFADWLADELESRGWSRSEAARRGGVSAAMFDQVINQQTKPGLSFCRGVARAFGMPLEDVFRLAGILPPLTDEDPTISQVLQQLSALSGPIRQRVLTVLQLVLDLAAPQSSSSPVPEIQLQSLDDVPAWLATLTPEQRADLADAIELTFPAESSERRKATA